MSRIEIPKDKMRVLSNLTKMIEKNIGIDNYLVSEQDVATKYNVDVEEIIALEKEAIRLEPEEIPKIRRAKILNNLYTKGLDYYKENEGGKKSDFTDAIILNKDGKILFLLRTKDSKIEPNKYCLPGGHLESFMSKENNILKEIKEETNLDIINYHLAAIKNINDGKNKIYYFICLASSGNGSQANGEVILNEREHSNYKWMTLAEIKEMSAEMFIFDLKEYLLKLLEK